MAKNGTRVVNFVVYTALELKQGSGVYATTISSSSKAWNPLNKFAPSTLFVLDAIDGIVKNALE